MRRGPGGAALPGAQGRGGPGVAPESLSPPLSRWGPPGHRSARGPSRQSLAGSPGQLLWLRPPPGRAAHGPLVALALTLYRGRNPPAFSPPIPTARRSPGPPSPAGPQTPSWAGPGLASASRARPRRGRAAPSAGPSGRTPAEVCRAVRLQIDARSAGPAARSAPPAEKPNKQLPPRVWAEGKPDWVFSLGLAI